MSIDNDIEMDDVDNGFLIEEIKKKNCYPEDAIFANVTTNPVLRERSKWNIKMSEFARYTHNPIRAIVEGLKIDPNPDKQMIALSIGE